MKCGAGAVGSWGERHMKNPHEKDISELVLQTGRSVCMAADPANPQPGRAFVDVRVPVCCGEGSQAYGSQMRAAAPVMCCELVESSDDKTRRLHTSAM